IAIVVKCGNSARHGFDEVFTIGRAVLKNKVNAGLAGYIAKTNGRIVVERTFGRYRARKGNVANRTYADQACKTEGPYVRHRRHRIRISGLRSLAKRVHVFHSFSLDNDLSFRLNLANTVELEISWKCVWRGPHET